MNKTPILVGLLGFMVISNISLFLFFDAKAQITFSDEYTIVYSSKTQIKPITETEEAKGCSVIHNDFTDEKGNEGILTFVCQSGTNPTPDELTIDEKFAAHETRLLILENDVNEIKIKGGSNK